MNILIVTAYPPVLHMHGGGVRMYHNIRILAEKHDVRVISFVESEPERQLLRSLEPFCRSVAGVLRIPDFRPHWLSLRPFLAREFSTPAMYQAIDNVFRSVKVDVLQCEYLQMAQFRRPGVFTIWTAHEVLSANAYAEFQKAGEPVEKLKLYYRWMQMLRYEVLMSRRFNRVVTMTGNDASYLRSYSPSLNVRPIPIGIDTAEFTPLAEEPNRPLEVLFVGNFRHHPNGEAAEFLIREIAPRFPEFSFVLPGANVPAHLLACSNAAFPGYIPDTRLLYRRPNTIVAAPLFSGTGQRVKLLEAFAMQCPVITTSVGALGFPVRDGHEALIANNAEEFAGALTRLARSEELRRRIGACGREMIVRSFGWEHIGGQLCQVVEEAVSR